MILGIRVDGNKKIGMGHFSRCRSIGEELRNRGEKVFFICSNDSHIPLSAGCENDYIRICTSSCDNWDIDKEQDVISGLGISTLLIDSYSIKQEYLDRIRDLTKTVLIDDLILFDYNVDAIINYNIEANGALYSDTQFPLRKEYTGIKYFPLRSNLIGYKKKQINREVQSVLLTSGGTDPFGCIDIILKAIRVIEHKDVNFYILIGPFFSEDYSRGLIKRYAEYEHIHFLSWGQNMGEIYSSVDLVVAPGSTTVYEALSLGIPCITFEFMDNQHAECVALDDKGIACWAGRITEHVDQGFVRIMRELFNSSLDYETRKSQSFCFKSEFDGKGVERIIEILLEVDNEKRA